MKPIIIRTATVSDATVILDIYGYYVANTAISMEYDVPSLAEFEKRIENTLGNYPYLVAEQNGKIIGYAYAGKFHPRAAFYRSAEVSIYIHKDAVKCGLGRDSILGCGYLLVKRAMLRPVIFRNRNIYYLR